MREGNVILGNHITIMKKKFRSEVLGYLVSMLISMPGKCEETVQAELRFFANSLKVPLRYPNLHHTNRPVNYVSATNGSIYVPMNVILTS